MSRICKSISIWRTSSHTSRIYTPTLSAFSGRMFSASTSETPLIRKFPDILGHKTILSFFPTWRQIRMSSVFRALRQNILTWTTFTRKIIIKAIPFTIPSEFPPTFPFRKGIHTSIRIDDTIDPISVKGMSLYDPTRKTSFLPYRTLSSPFSMGRTSFFLFVKTIVCLLSKDTSIIFLSETLDTSDLSISRRQFPCKGTTVSKTTPM